MAAAGARFAHLPQELANFHREQEAIFARREAALLEGYRKLNDAIADANTRADQRISTMQAEIEQQRHTLEETYQQRFKQFEEERAEFEKQRAEFDDRQRTHARRKHEELLREVIEKHGKFKISDETSRKRTSTSVTCYIVWAIAFLLYMGALALAWYDGGMRSLHWSMLATATLLAGSTLVFYIRWSDAWFRRHAEIEIEARSLEADFIRASWLVEMMFEWQKESQGKPFPEDALRTLTAGLFERPAATVVDHPVSQLITSLGRIKSFEAGKGSIKAEAAGGKQRME